MKTLRLTSFILGLAISTLPGNAGVIAVDLAAGPSLVVAAQADCYALGEDKAAEMGGKLAKAEPDTEGGQAVCRIVIVVPGAEGERPKREEIIIPQ